MGEASDQSRTRWAFWLLGAAILLPWNVLICTLPLLTSLLPADSTWTTSLSSYVTTTFTLGNFIFLGLAQRSVGKVSQAAQLRFALVRLVVITAGTAALIAFAFPLISGNAAYPVVLLAVSAMAANCTASLQCSVIGIASKWGSREMLAVMSGQGGIAVLISAAQLLLALVGTVSKKRKHAGEMAVTTADIVTGACLWLLAAAASVGCLLSSGAVSQPPITAVAAAVEEQEELLDADAEVAKPALESGNLQILRRNWIVNASVFVVFLVTLSIFPALTATISPAGSNIPKLLRPDVFVPLHFLLFNVGDYVGRTYLPAVPQLFITDGQIILMAAVSRFALLPLALGINVVYSNRTWNIWAEVLVFWAFVTVLGLTNGWISSLSMIVSSATDLNPRIREDERDVAGTIAGFCLTAGLVAGSVASFGMTALSHL